MSKPEDAPAPIKPLLDLVPNAPIHSKPFLFRKLPVKWRLLDSLEIAGCRTAGQKRTMAVLVDDMGLEPKDAFPLLQAGTLADTEREWFEYYVIGAAMTDEAGAPVGAGTPDDVAYRLADITTPRERGQLVEDYMAFEEEHDPSTFSDEDFEEIIAEAGKGAGVSTWLPYGSNALRNLLAIMAPRLVVAEMAVAEFKETEDMGSRVTELERVISQINRSKDGAD